MNVCRALVLAAALAFAAAAEAARIEMFYLGTPDCPYCRKWEASGKGALLNSADGRAIRFVEVRGETLRKPIVLEHYPAAYQWAFDQIGPSRGVPRFVLMVDGKVVLNAFGLGAYERDFLPSLRAIVAGASSRT